MTHEASRRRRFRFHDHLLELEALFELVGPFVALVLTGLALAGLVLWVQR